MYTKNKIRKLISEAAEEVMVELKESNDKAIKEAEEMNKEEFNKLSKEEQKEIEEQRAQAKMLDDLKDKLVVFRIVMAIEERL